MRGTLQSVSTLLTAVGLPYSPTRAGNGGLFRGCARLPSSDSSSAVSSPAQPGRLHQLDDLVRLPGERRPQRVVALVREIEIEREGVRLASVSCEHRVHQRFSTTRWHPLSAASPRARRSTTSFVASPGCRHSCHASLTMTTGARSHAPRHSTSIKVNVPLA